MGFTAKGKRDSSNNNNESWGLGFFLVFFPDINEQEQQPSTIVDINKKNTFKSTTLTTTTTSPPPSPPLPRRRPTTPYPHLLSKAQSTVSICALLVFLSLLFFTLSSFEPATPSPSFSTRRHLSSSNYLQSLPKPNYQNTPHHSPHALQGLGDLYRKGTRAMNDLTVGHVTESVTDQELRLFLRLFYKSTLSSKSDLSFIFPSPSHSSAFRSVISQETESFFKLVNRTQFLKPPESTRFDDEREFLSKEKEKGETIWGRGVRRDNSTESTRASYGSVVGFVVDELDPENSLSGFLDHVPMGMRRWACYPMLLGRVRRNFKHVVLVDVKEVLLLGDPLSRIRNRSPESVQLLSAEAGGAHNTNKQHGKKNSAKTQSRKPVYSAVVMGGARGVRRLSNAMLTEIVRVTTQHKKNSVTESGLFNQLVGNEFIMKNVNVNVVTSAESIPDLSSLTGLNSNSGSSSLSLSNYTMLRRGNSNGNSDSTSIIMKHVCGLELNSSVYSDCL